MIYRNLGKDTLGDGNKMTIGMKSYDRSTHNLGFAWRSTMGVGTLVPAMKILALPGDTYDIDIDLSVFTNPTVGPLFGNYKIQVDVFSCPIRLYIAQLHNNAIDVAMNMGNVKFPVWETDIYRADNPTTESKFNAINPSSVLAYLGKRGYKWNVGGEKEISNVTPLLCYWDIFANYYCNKQESKYYSISNDSAILTFSVVNWDFNPTNGFLKAGAEVEITYDTEEAAKANNCLIYLDNGEYFDGTQLAKETEITVTGKRVNYIFVKNSGLIQSPRRIVRVTEGDIKLRLKPWDLSTLNDIREDLLKQGKAQKVFRVAKEPAVPKNPIEDIIQVDKNDRHKSRFPQSGLAIKTYQSDMFTNFINSERIEGITNRTKVSTAGNAFTIDALNVSQHRYNYENRLAATNGTYKDYIEVSYTGKYGMRTETPMYEGGVSDNIVFEAVVNTAQTEENPLGELGGRGRLGGNRKGGKLRINVDEPSYLIGIVSITPLVDYCD